MSTLPKSCPHCDAGPGPYVNSYLCGTYLRAGYNERKHQSKHQSKRCMAREIESQQERIRQLIAERDKWQSAAQQSWKLREEFKALLGTDDVEQGVEKVRAWIKYAGRLEGAGDELADYSTTSATDNWDRVLKSKP